MNTNAQGTHNQHNEETQGLELRQQVWFALQKWYRSGDFIAEHIGNSDLPEKDKGLALEIAMGVARNYLLLETNVSHFCQKKPSTDIQLLLLMAFYQLQFLTRVPDYAVVYTTVQLALQKGRHQAGFVNAVLRELKRKGMPAMERIASDEVFFSQRYSVPQWLVSSWLQTWGRETTEARLRHALVEPPTWVRVNTYIASQTGELPALQQEIQAMQQSGLLGAEWHWERFLQVTGALRAVLSGTAFAKGWLSVQDPAAAVICDLLQIAPPQEQPVHGQNSLPTPLRVLDACAAPGGKTALLMEIAQGHLQVLATDSKRKRLLHLHDVQTRLGWGSVQTQVADWSKPQEPFASWGLFDRVLVDAPCSNLGVMARRPELKRSCTPELLQKLQTLQKQIITHTAAHVKPGGLLVYATCSPEPQETDEVVNEFIAQNPEFSIENTQRLVPGVQPYDGFYGCAMRKKMGKE
jgi:16S rRNA (cytosine967-C5)-methyltransferase